MLADRGLQKMLKNDIITKSTTMKSARLRTLTQGDNVPGPENGDVVATFDNVDIDNPTAIKTLCSSELGLRLRAVIVSGRPATKDPKATIDESDPAYSREVLRRNTRRVKGMLRRMRRDDVYVFSGLIPKKTIVPHFRNGVRIHVDEADLDYYNDFAQVREDGNFKDALRFIARLRGKTDFVCGGPLIELDRIQQARQLRPKLGVLTCQLGLFGFGGVETMAGGGLTFNGAAAPEATRAVLADWPSPIFMVPTDITKQPSLGFNTPADVKKFGYPSELVRMYEIFYRDALLPRKERIYPHDVHPAFLMAQLRGRLRRSIYTWERVCINRVGPQGQIDATFGVGSPVHGDRFVVKRANADAFMQLLKATVA
jgi:inosine-uridine nucleoside N-ribohydrolase